MCFFFSQLVARLIVKTCIHSVDQDILPWKWVNQHIAVRRHLPCFGGEKATMQNQFPCTCIPHPYPHATTAYHCIAWSWGHLLVRTPHYRTLPEPFFAMKTSCFILGYCTKTKNAVSTQFKQPTYPDGGCLRRSSGRQGGEADNYQKIHFLARPEYDIK